MFKEDLEWLNTTNSEFKEKLNILENKVDGKMLNLNNQYNGAFNYNISINYAQDTPNIFIDLTTTNLIPESVLNEIKGIVEASLMLVQSLESNKIRLIFEFE